MLQTLLCERTGQVRHWCHGQRHFTVTSMVPEMCSDGFPRRSVSLYDAARPGPNATAPHHAFPGHQDVVMLPVVMT
eukprot:908520-Amphidinium_carterae.1